MNVFGPPVASHGPKWTVVALFGLLAGVFVWLAWLALHQDGVEKANGSWEAAVCLALAIPVASFALGMSRRRVVLFAEGMSYWSIFGEKQIRWDDLLRFHYQATKQSVNFVPVGTYYWFRLVDSSGQKVRFGSGLARTESLANELLHLTRGPLLRRIASQFDSGADVDFGPISVNRQSSIVIKSSFGRLKRIAWDEVGSYAIQDGHFYSWRAGEKRATGPAVSRVPNVFVLHDLLEAIFGSVEQSSLN